MKAVKVVTEDKVYTRFTFQFSTLLAYSSTLALLVSVVET